MFDGLPGLIAAVTIHRLASNRSHDTFPAFRERKTMDFTEYIELLRNPGEREIPATIYDDLIGIHDDMVNRGAELDAGIVERDNRIKDLESQVSELKYQLAVEEAEDAPQDIESDEPDSETITIDDLFGDI